MATEKIISINTAPGVKNLNELRDTIKQYKSDLEQLNLGEKDYQETLQKLQAAQAMLRNAMHGTTADFKELTNAATGANVAFDENNKLVQAEALSYNELVRGLDILKQQWRATTDTVQRSKLTEQIAQVNDQLKSMDGEVGVFGRNVGNYQSAFKGMGDGVKAFGDAMKIAKGGAADLKGGLDALGKSPAITITALLVSAVSALVAKFKESEEGADKLKAGMANFKPVLDLVHGIIERLTAVLGDVVGKVSEFLGSSGLIRKITDGVMGVGNAILQYVAAPFKGVIAAIKVFKEQGVKGIGDAARAFGNEMKSGVSFKQNFQAGQQVAETLIAGAASKKKEVKAAGKTMAKDIRDGILEGLSDIEDEINRQIDASLDAMLKAQDEANAAAQKKADQRLKYVAKTAAQQKELNDILVDDERQKAAKAYEIQERANQNRLALLDQYKQEALDRGDLDAFLAYDQERAELEVEIETESLREKKRLRELDLQDAKAKVEAQKQMLSAMVSATSSVLGTIADLYEADEANSVKNANKIKALRISAATIDTISGATGAFMQASQTIPPPYGQIIGAATAAAVTAAGIAQIAQIKGTSVTSPSGNPTVPAYVSAPTITPDVQQVRTVTSSTEDERLNQMASPQRVYILSSDLEANREANRVLMEETTF